MKSLWSGNEATARGIYEAGVSVGSAYPGTPSTEIFESLEQYPDVYCEWAPNEKVALEVAYGAAVGGVRAVTAMKHVGLNVAADPLFTASYNGVRGGFVVITADDPSMHSSQNEQDNRHYAKAAKIPMFEPSDSEDSLLMMKEAFRLSEQYDTPVLFRTTTRVCHSKSIVEAGERETVEAKPYEKDTAKYIMTPSNANARRPFVEERTRRLMQYAETTPFNRTEMNGTKIGVITSGIAYHYAKEVFPADASFLKLGFTCPMPPEKIRAFAAAVDTLYVIEELDPFIETFVRTLGLDCIGKPTVPEMYELNPERLREALFGTKPAYQTLPEKHVARPPALCPGCPHRGLFVTLKKFKNAIVTGDIGCYTLGAAPPLESIDCIVCMGGGFTLAQGLAKAFDASGRDDRVIFGLVGDSTFFHSGVTGAVEMIYNRARTKIVPIVLENTTPSMTGQQENPGTGMRMRGEDAQVVPIERVLEAIGFAVIVVDPQDLDKMKAACDEAVKSEAPTAIVTRRPCVLIKRLRKARRRCIVDREQCRKCKRCLSVGCPAIFFKDGASFIDQTLCAGCTVCLQVCPFDVIKMAPLEVKA